MILGYIEMLEIVGIFIYGISQSCSIIVKVYSKLS